jgi:DNA invertase Pin-like site-specific DNA recombinase
MTRKKQTKAPATTTATTTTKAPHGAAKVGYVRVSTTGQNLEAQREAVESAGATKVFEDMASGKDTQRPGLQACLAYLREGDELLVARLDRFARSTSDLLSMLERLHREGVRVTFLDRPDMSLTDATGKLVLSILGACAEFERSLILKRTSEGRESAKRRGVKFGRPALVDAELGARVKALKDADPERSMADIARELKVSRASAYRALAEM